ncbi:AMP-binding protein [Streptomyces murinus]|uniref:AMP-binding protein n=1 Tax=Streptomyces murinus TaxID=33900 RepID=UPI001FC9375F|nr:AMP-binding protein [Streptomyces murinus]
MDVNACGAARSKAAAPRPEADVVLPAPADEVARAYRVQGWWRSGETFATDLRRGAARHPRRAALVQHHALAPEGRRLTVLSYGRLDLYVDRFAGALAALGVRPGDPVAYQLPSRWETAALFLACVRLGAVAVPVLPGFGVRGLGQVLALSQARVCVVPDVWEGVPYAGPLAALAAELPWLRHRVVLATTPADVPAAASRTGAVDFGPHFLRTPHERGPYRPAGRRLGPCDPADRVCLQVAVRGPGDACSLVLHSANTLYAGCRALAAPVPPGTARPDEESHRVSYSALPLTSLASILFTVCRPLTVGGTGVLQDVWAPGSCLDLLAGTGAGHAYAAPAQWAEVDAEQRCAPRPLPRLRLVLSGGRTSTPPELLAALPQTLGAPVRGVWGAPELGLGIVARGDIPAERAGRSDGMPVPGLEVSALADRAARTDGEDRLRVRGPSVCLGVRREDGGAPEATWGRAGGWVDVGDLARPDGLGGVHVTARAHGRTGAFFLVPVDRLEAALHTHPGVREAVVVPWTDAEAGERPCAVVVPAAEDVPPALPDLRAHLTAQGIPDAALPNRLELVGSLPRDDRGRLRRDGLRGWLERLRPGRPRSTP